MEWGKGMVQREEKERERAMMEKERGKGFARHADDGELNEEQKAKELWNDPAAAFLTVRVSLSRLVVRMISQSHRKNGARARGDRNTLAQRRRRIGSGSSPDIGGTAWTEATASSTNTFNARTNGSVRGPKAIRGAWTTCEDGFSSSYIYVVCVGTAVRRGFRPRPLVRSEGEREAEEKRIRIQICGQQRK